MLQEGSYINIVDNSGISLVKCIKVKGHRRYNFGKIGSYVLVSIKNYKIGKGLLKDERKWKRFGRGTKHLVFIIRTKQKYIRSLGTVLRFSDNAGIMVNKKKIPLGTKLKGPVLIELTKKNKHLLTMSNDLV